MGYFSLDLKSNPGQKKSITAGKLIKSGGAGNIHLCEDHPDTVLKLYKNEKDLGLYEHKLRSMLESPPLLKTWEASAEEVPMMTWPLALVLDDKGAFVGYQMPLMNLANTVSLERFMQRRMRKHEGLSDFYGHRIEVARNLSRLIEVLHQKGHFVIDLKPQNCVLHRTTFLLTMLDCDGFKITSEKGEVYPAHQITHEYLAPEFVKKSPQELGEEQDQFALAVMIFKLLNNGIHPFQAGMKRGHKTIDKMIAEKKYAYGLSGSGSLIPNNQSMHEYFPQQLREAFDRAFQSTSERPTALEWRQILSELITPEQNKGLKRCKKNPAEHLDLGLGCGQCAVDNGTNITIKVKYPRASAVRKTNNSSNFTTKRILQSKPTSPNYKTTKTNIKTKRQVIGLKKWRKNSEIIKEAKIKYEYSGFIILFVILNCVIMWKLEYFLWL